MTQIKDEPPSLILAIKAIISKLGLYSETYDGISP